jgi:hypothetical protein
VKKHEIIYKFGKQSEQSSPAAPENSQNIDGVEIHADSELP